MILIVTEGNNPNQTQGVHQESQANLELERVLGPSFRNQ